MRSMTGHGRGETHHGGLKFSVELNAVNRKQADIIVDLPREILELESPIREAINAVVSRGRLNVTVSLSREDGTIGARMDAPLARAYLREMRKLQRKLKVSGDITLETILRCPGVMKTGESDLNPQAAWFHIEKALKLALAGLVRMREKEGGHLRRDILKRLDLLAKGLRRIKGLAPAMVTRYREQLRERIRKSRLDFAVEDHRLLQEMVLLAERSDITEEITRLESHLAQFREKLGSTEPVGRALDFLAQEILRETNTIGSKSILAEISQTVVHLKSEVEKIREQSQNVE